MVTSFVVLLISILFRVFFGRLSLKYSWMGDCLPWLNWIIVGCAALFVTFTVIKIVKAIKA